MRLIVGLGNPGEKYENTRHNVGFILVKNYLSTKGLQLESSTKFNSSICKDGNTLFAVPQTFMNNSGDAVSKLLNYYSVSLDKLVVIHDDADIPQGEYKYKKGVGAAGHHGVEDIVEKLGSQDFWRLRVGVGRPVHKRFELQKFVLSKLTSDELLVLQNLDIGTILSL